MKTDVLECLKYTINTYNNNMKSNFLKILVDEGVAFKKKSQVSLFEEGKVEIDEADINNTIISCLKKSSKVMMIFEKFNLQRSYKYAVLFSTIVTDTIIKTVESIPLLDEDYSFAISKNINSPVRISCDDKDMLLFNKVYDGYDTKDGKHISLKFPVVVVIDRKKGVVEIRFDTIKKIFTVVERENTVYMKLIAEVRKYLDENLGITLLSLDLTKIIDIAADDSREEVKMSRQQMNFKNGSRADFRTSDNGDYSLPYISELKSIINNYEEELDKCPNIKRELNRLVSVREKTSEYPIIEVDFVGKPVNHVKFTFDYYNTGYCMLNFYSHKDLIGMERMDDVTEFIKENIL